MDSVPSDVTESLKETPNEEAPNDSLTLGQLKSLVKQFPNKLKSKEISFIYADSDRISNEINEFYSYVEISQCFENQKVFEEGFDELWTTSVPSERITYIEYLLDALELKDPEKRFAAARKLLYIAQGTFGETQSVNQHLHWIFENNKLLRKRGALLSYFQALKLASQAHNHFSRPDLNISSEERQAYIDDTHAEIGFYLTLLYMLVEVHREDSTFDTELVESDPPMVVFLFEVIASLREKNAKGYPVKKLLLLLWKVILTSLGGIDEIDRLKNVVRQLNGLPSFKNQGFLTKTTPMDYYTFQTEVTQKFPTYTPPPYQSIIPDSLYSLISNGTNSNDSTTQNYTSATNGNFNNNPTPKSRKQQFQTNQRQPFIFPFSRSAPTVPKSIQEAGDLYLKFMYTSLSTWQCSLEKQEMKSQQNLNILYGIKKETPIGNWGHDTVKQLENLQRDQLQIEEKDIEKLGRVENLYMSILPHMQNIIIVLLKLLLATVSSNNNNTTKGAENVDNGGKRSSTTGENSNNTFSNGNTVEEIDIMRHREITSKAVSAILLLMLKHFKLSHALKFEYLAQLLVDSNCLLLILKMFGLQDVGVTVKAKNEVEELNFFQYCNANDTKDVCNSNGNKPLDGLPSNGHEKNLNIQNMNPKNLPENEETDTMKEDRENNSSEDYNVETNYCWRNFFAAINFLRILQKLTKRKTHRISLLVQYKSSAILKKILKVSHPLSELYALKVLKNQIPFVGRKWRQSNMKVITSIYLRCRPDLRDEWIASTDADAELEDALPQEQALRELIKFYNNRKYGPLNGPEKQSNSSNNQIEKNSLPDIFPPNRSQPSKVFHSAYIADDIMLDETFLTNWEQWLQEEVYIFSMTKPHLRGVDEYYNDENAINFFGDGSEWDIPPTPPVKERDPFTTVEWQNLSPVECKSFEDEWKTQKSTKLSYDEDEMEYFLDSSSFANGDQKDDIELLLIVLRRG
ncbi:hypothetical protein G9A89_008489 [Geosiphon pyriformis]|nr:hypothetical protein G9A89_008489 [Geosiphon pyriformis]